MQSTEIVRSDVLHVVQPRARASSASPPPSYTPPREFRVLRAMTRNRRKLVAEHSREGNRIQKLKAGRRSSSRKSGSSCGSVSWRAPHS